MDDIDLIPREYRTHRWQRKWLKGTAMLSIGLAATLMLAVLVLQTATATTQSRVDALHARQTEAQQQRVKLDQLSTDKVALEDQLDLLLGLRSGAAAEDMFVTIDRALAPGDLWFLEWQFERAGVLVSENVHTVNTGYFIVVPDDPARAVDDNAAQVRTNMLIRGQARDHSALSGFVRRLFAQAEISDVRIRRTNLSQEKRLKFVDFELDITLNTEARGT